MIPTRFAVVFLVVSAAWAKAQEKPLPQRTTDAEGVEFFEKKIRPVLVKHCYACHSAEAKKLKGELRLDSRDGMRRGGVSGPAIVPGNPAKSLLIQSLRHADGAEAMPPQEKLPAEVIADFETWVKMGAPDPRDGSAVSTGRMSLEQAKQFWSFKPVIRPAVTNGGHINPIDNFIEAKLREKGLTPSLPADKRTLLRRATYDLTGLPPTPEEIEAFLKDEAPDAFAKVVDRLLASPAYGERWGRHWMDVIRYADTAGDNSDYPIPQMYKYRNWIIDAFNRDLPYDEFIRQQIAGDLLPYTDEPDRYAKIIATGYLANTKRFGSYEDARYPWHLTYEDQIDNLGRTFLALTIHCCRCHDHKFDPLTQHDYYALYGFFSSTRYPRPGIELDKVQRDFVPLAPPDVVATIDIERAAKQQELDARVKQLDAEKKAAEKKLIEAEKIANDDEKKAVIAELNKQILSYKQKIKAAQKESEDFARTPRPYETAYAVTEGKNEGRKRVGNACVHIKGDPERLGPEVPRGFPEVLGGHRLPETEKGSGRLHLANWLADPKNPLTARVMVNRIWQYHFGQGIVPTSNNFGVLGLPPTHPELLDWLASEFVERRWSIKAMHRLIMLSRTYQQASTDNPANARIDPTNDYLWKFNRRRLDAESLRDTLLAVSGQLDREPGGPHPFPDPRTWNFTQHNPFKAVYETNKRSVYVMTQRLQRHPFFGLFDGADTNASTERRSTSTTPLQALYLMNDPFVHTQAKGFTERILSAAENDTARIQRAYELLYGRLPSDEDIRATREYLAAVQHQLMKNGTPADQILVKAWQSLTRAMFLSNEFIYID